MDDVIIGSLVYYIYRYFYFFAFLFSSVGLEIFVDESFELYSRNLYDSTYDRDVSITQNKLRRPLVSAPASPSLQE